MVSNKAVPDDLNLRFRSKFNHDFTNHGCLHCVILKKLLILRKKSPHHRVRGSKFFFQNFQNKIFESLKMFKNSMKLTIAACQIYSKISNKDNNTALEKYLCCHYFWSLLWCDYCCGSPLIKISLTVHIQLIFIHATHF